MASGARVWAVIETVLGKEILYVRRNTGILVWAGDADFPGADLCGQVCDASGCGSLWVFPAAVAYTLLAICPLSYNCWGWRLRGRSFTLWRRCGCGIFCWRRICWDSLMALVEIVLIFVIITYMAGMPSLGRRWRRCCGRWGRWR